MCALGGNSCESVSVRKLYVTPKLPKRPFPKTESVRYRKVAAKAVLWVRCVP